MALNSGVFSEYVKLKGAKLAIRYAFRGFAVHVFAFIFFFPSLQVTQDIVRSLTYGTGAWTSG